MTALAIALASALAVAAQSQPAPTPAPDNAPPAATQPATASGFLYKTVVVDGESYAYSVYVPPDYTPDRAWPVILFLHGSGERGDDGFLQTEVGLPRAIRRNHKQIPAIVVMPQCRDKQLWIAGPGDLGPMGKMALACLEQTSREFRCDTDRVYLTGLSLGGLGSWHLAAMYPKVWAAVVPVCGFVEFERDTGVAARLAPALKELPIWTFHGDDDKAVSVERTREIVAAVKAAGGEQIRYTEYPGVGHNAWDKCYFDQEMWTWLFAQRRSATP